MQLQVLRPATFLKGSQQSVSCEYCEIFKNSFLYRTPPVSASEYYPGNMKLKTHFYFEKRKILYCTEVNFILFFCGTEMLHQSCCIMHYSRVVIILFNKDLYKSTFPTYSFKNLVFRLSIFCPICFELFLIFVDL